MSNARMKKKNCCWIVATITLASLLLISLVCGGYLLYTYYGNSIQESITNTIGNIDFSAAFSHKSDSFIRKNVNNIDGTVNYESNNEMFIDTKTSQHEDFTLPSSLMNSVNDDPFPSEETIGTDYDKDKISSSYVDAKYGENFSSSFTYDESDIILTKKLCYIRSDAFSNISNNVAQIKSLLPLVDGTLKHMLNMDVGVSSIVSSVLSFGNANVYTAGVNTESFGLNSSENITNIFNTSTIINIFRNFISTINCILIILSTTMIIIVANIRGIMIGSDCSALDKIICYKNMIFYDNDINNMINSFIIVTIVIGFSLVVLYLFIRRYKTRRNNNNVNHKPTHEKERSLFKKSFFKSLFGSKDEKMLQASGLNNQLKVDTIKSSGIQSIKDDLMYGKEYTFILLKIVARSLSAHELDINGIKVDDTTKYSNHADLYKRFKICGVYVYTSDSGQSIFKQVEFVDDNKKRVAFDYWINVQQNEMSEKSSHIFDCYDHSLTGSDKHYEASKMALRRRIANLSLKGMTDNNIMTIRSKISKSVTCISSDYCVPFLDLYGRLHKSQNHYICSMVDDEFASNLLISLPNNNNHAHLTAMQDEKILICDDDNVCSIKHVSSKKGVQSISHNVSSQSDINLNTERFKHLLIVIDKARKEENNNNSLDDVSSMSSTNNTNNMNEFSSILEQTIRSGEFDFLLAQLSPEDNFVFRTAKTVLSFIGSVANVVPKFSTDYNDDPLSNPDYAVNLSTLSSGTNMKFGKSLTYDEFLEMAKPGDMVAVHGFQTLSNIICSIQSNVRGCSKFLSHVGHIIDTTYLRANGMVDGEKYLVESSAGGGIIGNMSDCVPEINGFGKHGVQIRSMRALLRQAIGHNSIYILCPLDAKNRRIFEQKCGPNRRNKNQKCAMAQCIEMLISVPYTTTPSNFMLGVLSGKFMSNSSSTRNKIITMMSKCGIQRGTAFGSELYCSEYMAYLYVMSGNYQLYHPYKEGEFDIKKHIIGKKPSELGYLSPEILSSKFVNPRQIYPIDFFIKDGLLPYIFDDLHVILPLERIPSSNY